MGVEHPDWLPVDWKICVRIRSSGKKDKYYINPLNGLKFNSRVEVLRYLKNAEKDIKLKELNKIDVKKTVGVKLPLGWVKEIKIRRKGGKIRRDTYYIDPVSGRHFRSMQEVFRYLETKESGKAESEVDHSISSTAGVEGQKLTGKKADKIFTENERVKSGSKGASLINGCMPKSKYVGQREIEDDSVNWDLPYKQQKENGSRTRGGGLRQNKRLDDGKLKKNIILDQSLQPGLEGAAVQSSNMLETNALEEREKEKNSLAEDRQHEIVAPQNKRKKLYSKWMNGLPRRTSKRLACMEADPLLELKTREQAREVEINTTGNFCKSDGPNENPTTCRTEKPNDNKEKEPANLPLEDLSSLEENEDGPVDFNKDVKREKHLDSSLNNLLMDPCIEFAIKTLTGAIPIEDVNKVDSSCNQTSGSSTVLPSADIWADPCFEFAVKMLTSENPTENGSHFQISFQQPLSSSGASGCHSLSSPKIR